MHASRVAVAAAACMFTAGCDEPTGTPAPPPGRTVASPDPPAGGEQDAWFVDAAGSAGLDFVHVAGTSGAYYFPEITAAGAALFDMDGDGDLDACLLQCFDLDDPAGRGVNRVFRNDLDESGALRFTDVTDVSGAGDAGYGMGCAVGDVDGDGDDDLYVTNYGDNRLFMNDGSGVFTVAGDDAIPPEPRWSTSATFLDADLDGDLDLFVTNYVEFTTETNRVCHGATGERDYCGPQVYDPVPDRFFRNRGDGTFEDASVAAGFGAAFGSGLGVVQGDFDLDGAPDLYVANDGNANQLWMNRGDGTFEDRALFAGAAYNADGAVEAGMGVTAGDVDLDGDEDLFLTHLLGETNTLLVNDGTGLFIDRTVDAGIATDSRPLTGFGTRWADLDNDGLLDLFCANGAVKIEADQQGNAFPYGNPNRVLRNGGPPAFRLEPIANAGAIVRRVETSRGAAFGDVDNDGDVDVLVTTSNGPARLLVNQVGAQRAWIGFDLVPAATAVGALVRVEGTDIMRRVQTGGSYCSANDRRLTIGLGDHAGPVAITVTWPGDDTPQRFTGLALREYHVIVAGRAE
ncbi:MAG: CRTAC1 family protein [Planctomycetota bacterium]